MKSFFNYIIVISVISSLLVSCSFKEDLLIPESDNNGSSTLLIATVENFSRHNVTTKSIDDDERKVNDIAILLFGTPYGEDESVLIAEPLYAGENQLNFILNTSAKYIANIQDKSTENYKSFADFVDTFVNNEGKPVPISSCHLYIVANMSSRIQEESIAVLSYKEVDFLAINYNSNGIDIPDNGFPMIGFETVDLNTSSTQKNIDIVLKKLFAKINVKFRVQTEQTNNPGDVSNYVRPHFRPQSWQVCNVPTSVTLKEFDIAQEEAPATNVINSSVVHTFNFGSDSEDQKVEHSTSIDEWCEFSFYMPEYKVKPEKDRSSLNEDIINEGLAQGYKPTFCGSEQKPAYVKIIGEYSDHQGHISTVQYDLYLGQNEVDDFQVKRNQELNNDLLIKGLTNHIGADQNTVSVDHRVHITSTGYSISIERETLLDSHYEFRPMDISIQEGGIVVVKMPKNGQNSWFSAELSNINNKTGLYDSNKPGFRKYFTNDLVESLDRNLTASDDTVRFVLNSADVDNNRFRIWFYFDENVDSPYDPSLPDSDENKLFREGKIYVDHYDSQTSYQQNKAAERNRQFAFRQLNLWSINTDRVDSNNVPVDYSIEYFEEYLYNYAADDNYGVIDDGMPWGFYENGGRSLSNKYQALYANPSSMSGLLGNAFSLSELYTEAFNEIDARYDFYLTRDFPEDVDKDLVKARDYKGLEFTQEIAATTGIVNKRVSLSQNVDSAVEYCFNKNKRNQNGEVERIHWYLPAIDETEEILVDGFDYFPVFQSKWYWSSQSSYDKYDYTASSYFGSGLSSSSGYYYKDDIDRARATRVTVQDSTKRRFWKCWFAIH